MLIASALLALASVLSVPAHQEERATTERIDAAVAELEAAFKDGDSAARIAALRASVDALDKRVVALVAKGLNDKDREVALAACDTLGRMPHADSRKALEGFYKKEKPNLGKDEEGLVAVLKSIGRLGHPDGIATLTDDPFKATGYPVIQARFLGLGNIRSTKSLEELFSLLDKVGPNSLDRYMSDIRLALVRLTGEDRGDDSRQWQSWWQDNKKTFKVQPEPKPMPADMQTRWDAYWGIEAAPEDEKEG